MIPGDPESTVRMRFVDDAIQAVSLKGPQPPVPPSSIKLPALCCAGSESSRRGPPIRRELHQNSPKPHQIDTECHQIAIIMQQGRLTMRSDLPRI